MDEPVTSSAAQVDAAQTRAYIATVSATPQLIDREPAS
jgi:hypothetical protein